jgi:hypothetical protein
MHENLMLMLLTAAAEMLIHHLVQRPSSLLLSPSLFAHPLRA